MITILQFLRLHIMLIGASKAMATHTVAYLKIGKGREC